MDETFFVRNLRDYNLVEKVEIEAKSPSNIALIKYWGKKEVQIPTNPSISFTLTKAYTETTIEFNLKKEEKQKIKLFLGPEEKPSFIPKIEKFIKAIDKYCPILTEYDLTIHTKNSFPHSSGIASSASGMSALAKCFVELEEKCGLEFNPEEKNQRISFLARIGSGSACRSVFPGLALWGKTEVVKASSDLFAIPYNSEVHEVFKTFHDTILLIHEGEKDVSSTAGHSLMNNHPFAEQRFKQANENLKRLLPVLKSGDLNTFGEIVEEEALSLHAVMLTSRPSFILMKPNTLRAIEIIRNFRKETKTHLFFTLDAGANLHLLYPEKDKIAALNLIEEKLKPLCQNEKVIFDKVAIN